MRNKILPLALLTSSALTANAQELKKEEKPLIHNAFAVSSWNSKYLGSYGFSSTETPVIQIDLGFSLGRINYDVWSNYDLKRNKLTEADHTLSTSFDLGKLTLSHSLVYFNSPSEDFGDCVELGLRASSKNLPVNISFFAGHIFGKGIKPGQAFDLQASKSFSLTDRLSIGTQADVWYNNAYWAKESGFSHVQGKVSLNCDLGKGFSAQTYIKGQKAIESLGGTFKDNHSYGFSLSKSF